MSGKEERLNNRNPDIIEYQNIIRTEYIKENKDAKKGQIVFVGSSHMERFPIDIMQKSLNLNKIIYNRGICGTVTSDVLEHINTIIFDLEPSKIFINIGSNDIAFSIPMENILQKYGEILDQIKEKLPNTIVYVMAYYPVNTVKILEVNKDDNPAMSNSRNNSNLQAANEKIKVLAEKYGYSFINVNNGIMDDNGNLKYELTYDGLHMTQEGYNIVLQNLMKYLK